MVFGAHFKKQDVGYVMYSVCLNHSAKLLSLQILTLV